ncbi:hypothetical protein [Desulfosporosinus youngiae]|uniref:Uncharacterized protein n=1 Tax=Desulfosporosinus youngiae DSM 17734 TaxID=768710 RepID=H5Y3E1_9FIRM|nr:hypothetical protein [Desulfosporosinus youngiae]EHQ88910.1 hypothetical protein DesyoDRAFT_1782 [Desulfosporosinus youngiae DSM 17734]
MRIWKKGFNSRTQNRHNAAKAVDGNTATRWSSVFSDPQWIYGSDSIVTSCEYDKDNRPTKMILNSLRELQKKTGLKNINWKYRSMREKIDLGLIRKYLF